MKHFLLICALFPLVLMAQTGNGGLSAENSFGKLEYAAYSNGEYLLKATNKQTCNVSTRFQWLNKDSVIIIPAGTTLTIHLPGIGVVNTALKSKPLDRCEPGSADMGWLEISSPASLPVTFHYFKGTKISDSKMKLEFDVEDTEGDGEFNLQASFDGKTWETILIVLPYGSGYYTIYVEKAQKPDGSQYFLTSFK